MAGRSGQMKSEDRCHSFPSHTENWGICNVLGHSIQGPVCARGLISSPPGLWVNGLRRIFVAYSPSLPSRPTFLMKDWRRKRKMNDKKSRVVSSMSRVFEKRTKDCLKFEGGVAGHSFARDEGCHPQNPFAVNVRSNESIKRPSDRCR